VILPRSEGRAAEQEVAINLGIVAAHQVAAAKQRDNVIEKPPM